MSALDRQLRDAANVLTVIREDLEDVGRRERQPLTGQTVAVAMGEICAQIDALAHVCQVLVEAAQDARQPKEASER